MVTDQSSIEKMAKEIDEFETRIHTYKDGIITINLARRYNGLEPNRSNRNHRR
jgi:hypothetical protein